MTLFKTQALLALTLLSGCALMAMEEEESYNLESLYGSDPYEGALASYQPKPPLAPTSTAMVPAQPTSTAAIRPQAAPLSNEELAERLNTCDAVGFIGRGLEHIKNDKVKLAILKACGSNEGFRRNHPIAFKALGGKDSDPIDNRNFGFNVPLPENAAEVLCEIVGNFGILGNTFAGKRARDVFKTICCNPKHYPTATEQFITKHPNAARTIGCRVIHPAPTIQEISEEEVLD